MRTHRGNGKKASVAVRNVDGKVRRPNGLPYNTESERGVLGCLLNWPEESIPIVRDHFGEELVFYDSRHQMVFDTIVKLDQLGRKVDVITVSTYLEDAGELERIGGIAFLVQLQDGVVSVAQLESYAREVYSKFQLRQAIGKFRAFEEAAHQVPENVDEWLSHVEEHVFTLPRSRRIQTRSARELGGRIEKQLERYRNAVGHITGLATGFAYWDKLTGGLQPSELYILGGRPGTGKTSLAMNVVERVALWDSAEGTKIGHPVGVLSLEMRAEDLILRMMCSRARVNFHKLRTGMMSKEDRARLGGVLEQISAAPIYIDDSSNLSAMEMRSRLRQMKVRYGIRLAVVDYLQLAKLPPEFQGDRVGGIGYVSGALMMSAKELEIPILVVSQLSREPERRGRKHEVPTMSDLRDSGAIEQDAHFIGILYRDVLPEEEEMRIRDELAQNPLGEISLPVKMEVCKNRNGPSGTAMKLIFQRWCMRFEDIQRPTRDSLVLEPIIYDE